MTGGEHFREAERLAQIVHNGEEFDTERTVGELIALAQVHATLAGAEFTAQLVDATRERGTS